MDNVQRRSFAVTFKDSSLPEVADCLQSLDEVVARLRTLAEAGQCTFQDTLVEPLEPINTISYRTLFGFFKAQGAGSRSQFAANTMQTLFTMRTSVDEPAVRFYCQDYHHAPGVCACPAVILPVRAGARRIRYKSLYEVSVARWWLVDRADVLALTDEQLAAVDVHPSTRQHLVEFVVWLRANPDAR